MAIYDISADAAFALLRWRSQELNIKLHQVAAKLVADVPTLLRSDLSCSRQPVDRYLMTLNTP